MSPSGAPPESKENRPRRWSLAGAWLPVLGYIALIFNVSSIHGDQIPSPFPYVDKLAHLMEYALLGLLLGRAIRFTLVGRSSALAAAATVAAGAVVALLDELYQRRIPGRMSDPLDWLTDVVAVSGAVLFTRFVHIRPLLGGKGPGAGQGADPGAETPSR